MGPSYCPFIASSSFFKPYGDLGAMKDVFARCNFDGQAIRCPSEQQVRAAMKLLAIAYVYVLFAAVFFVAVDADEDHEELHDMMKFKEFKVGHSFRLINKEF